MGAAAILAIVAKAITYIDLAVQSGNDVSAIVTSVKNLVTKKPEDVTTEELAALEAELDRNLADFNTPIDGASEA